MSRLMHRLWLAIIVCMGAALACGGDDGGEPVDLTEAVFDRSRLLEVEIEMEASDWDALRLQTRSLFDVLGASCLKEAPERPFTYFPATVTIDGETLADVGVRKKGFFGSLSTTKPSLKLKFTEYDADQRYSGMKRMTMNNAKSDPSYVKQCLGYDVFARAGIPSPRCNFATITVNGESLGVFVHVESIKKAFIARHFDDNDGNLYEGALSDFRPGWVDTFQKKTNERENDRSDIEALVATLQGPDDGLIEALEPQLDIESFTAMWAAELLIYHADGYARNTNNFYIYDDPTSGRFSFIPWGIDSIMFDDGQLPWESGLPPASVWAEGVLARRLYGLTGTRARYFEELERQLTMIWSESQLESDIAQMTQLIAPHITAAEQAGHDNALDDLRRFVDHRRGVLEEAMASEPSWDRPLRDPWCIDAIGATSGTFDTTFGTLDSPDPVGEGAATLTAEVGGSPYSILDVGAIAGRDPDSENAPVIRLVAQISATELLVVQLTVDDGLMTAGGTLPIDWTRASGVVINLDFSGGEPEFELVGITGDGTITISEGGLSEGDPIAGSFEATIYESFF